VRFHLDQRIAGDPDAVAAVFTDPEFYGSLEGLTRMSRPEVLGCEVIGEYGRPGSTVVLRLHCRFIGRLSPAVRAVVDPAKLTWVEESRHDLAARWVSFRLNADHYADRFRCAGSYWFEPAGDGYTTRRFEGDLTVRAAVVGRRVEQAIVSGLGEHFQEEVPFVEKWVAEKAH
jgi:Protein of unknown function (DUF2505)